MIRLLTLTLLLAVSLPAAAAGWQLDSERSSLYFLSIKKNDVAEVHQFDRLSGSYDHGEAKLVIDLTSVDTGIDVRDERMREHLFETGSHPKATVTVEVPEQRVADLKPGEQMVLDSGGTLALHGQSHEVDTPLSVTRLGDGRLEVANVRPVVVNAGDYGLARGVDKLREIAGLSSISPAVPVQFTLYFSK